MKVSAKFVFLILLSALAERGLAAIVLHQKDATVWLPTQLISGKVSGLRVTKLTVHINQTYFDVPLRADSSFLIQVQLQEQKNKIWVTSGSGSNQGSDTLMLNLGYRPEPAIRPYATVAGSKVILQYEIASKANQKSLAFRWILDSENPAPCEIENAMGEKTSVRIPKVDGTYYFKLQVIDAQDTAYFGTSIIRTNGKLRLFDLEKEHATWIDHAVIYQITPANFVKKGSFDDITKKLPELQSLGINTIWLQPVFKTFFGGQGYDVIDYLALRAEFGDEEQLRKLISTARQLHMKVLFDMVPNHTSIHHPYAMSAIQNGRDSHYYAYYQHSNDGKAYSSHYQKDSADFVSYFWKDLVNLDYNNPEVQQWMIEVCKYWVRKFDIDGYRFDAVWGINARSPAFSQRLRRELKAIKPGLFLLAEDKGSIKDPFINGYDAAYDWTPDTSWVSQWSWQTKYDPKVSPTIFNTADSAKRVQLLKAKLFDGNEHAGMLLRFLENNDVPRFIASHNLQQTKMAAGLVFSLPGIPMIYNGQEIGLKSHPYSSKAIFNKERRIQSGDSTGLFNYYKLLVALRLKHPAFTSGRMAAVQAQGNGILAFQRFTTSEKIIVVLNMYGSPAITELSLEGVAGTEKNKLTQFKDLLSGQVFASTPGTSRTLSITVPGYAIRLLEKTN
jgi:cyclomaltodextrinase